MSKCAHAKTTSTRLPPGLVGTECTAQITMEGKEVNCLDMGSQVTTIPLSFYKSHLPHHRLKSLDDLLDVELEVAGANGEEVPYLRYIELNLTFPEEFLGKETEVPTLVLVVPDVNNAPQILIGTNSLDVLYSNYVDRNGCRPQSSLPGVVLKILEVQRQAGTEALGRVKVQGNDPDVVPAGSTVIIDGLVHVSGAHGEKWVAVEAPTASSLPGGLLVASSLCILPVKCPYRVPVLLRNETQNGITIPPKTVLAEVHAVQQVMGKEHSADSIAPETRKMGFDFGDSPFTT